MLKKFARSVSNVMSSFAFVSVSTASIWCCHEVEVPAELLSK